MENKTDKQQLRSFAFIVGGMFAIIGLWPVVIHRLPYRTWAVTIAAALIAAGLLVPSSLAPVYRWWMKLGHVLGWINTRVILGVIFYGLVTPIGAIRRMMGKDPMQRRLRPDLQSYRLPRSERPPSHLKRQY